MFDPMSAYRSTQVTSSSPVGQVVLLYEGAIRYGMRHLAQLERHDFEAAHNASIRCQEIVSALRESLDMSAGGQVATSLDALYDFILRRLVAGNVGKEPRATQEALDLLRELLEAWRAIGEQTPVTAARRPAAVSEHAIVGSAA